MTDEDLRPVICWYCESKFLIEPQEERGRCPGCKKVNEIPLEYADVDNQFKDQFILVRCSYCQKKILIKKESDYVVCSRCKSTVIVERDVLNEVPIEYSNLTPNEYYLLVAKENSFNPYHFPTTSDYYLEPYFEKKLIMEKEKEKEEKEKDKEMGKSKNKNNKEIKKEKKITTQSLNGYEHLFDTIYQNEMAITNKFINK